MSSTLVDALAVLAPLVYLVRLLAYLLIIVAIWQKNRPRGD
jgi:hypothetical protein